MKLNFHRGTFAGLFAVAALCFGGEAFAALSGVTIDGSASAVGAVPDINAATLPTIAATSTGNSFVWINFKSGTSSWKKQMTLDGSAYKIVMPLMPVGKVSYRVEAGETLFGAPVEALPDLSTYYTYNVVDPLPELRRPNLPGWYTSASPTVGSYLPPNSYTGNINTSWRGVSITMNSADYSVNLKAITGSPLQHYLDPALRTSVATNVGSIWFKARFTGGEGLGTLLVEKSTAANHRTAHQTIETIQVPYSPNWTLFRIDINSDEAAYYRIRHPSGVEDSEEDNIQIKDIVITPVAADVIMDKEPVEFTPGYPSRFDPVTFTISVTNKYELVPASDISPKLVWRLNRGPWNTSAMTNTTGSNYSVTLPPMVPGRFEYYYRTDFTGYGYKAPIFSTPGATVANLDDYALWLDANGNINESLNPEYLPYFEHSQLYNLSVDPPQNMNDGSQLGSPFDYYEFTIRRFRSMHDTMTLDIIPLEDTVLAMEPAYAMEQVADYVWQTVLYTTNAVNVGMNVIGTYRYNDGATDYEVLPHTWGDEDQDETARNPPMSGYAVDSGLVPRIRMEIDYKGFLMFRFNALTGFYEIRRAAWQDFNAWQAPNAEFSRSFGLFETLEFLTNLDGFPPTAMASSGFTPFEDISPFTGDTFYYSSFLSGLRVWNTWLIEEQQRPPAGPLSTYTNQTVRNKALRIEADPYGLGSVETTSLTRSDGRDTLKMRVRASLNDDNIAYYKNGSAFGTSYEVSADVTTTSFSPDEPSVSVYGFYQDAYNYLEYRVTQLASLRNASDRPHGYRLRGDIIQMKNGVSTVLKTATYGNNDSDYRLDSKKWRLKLMLSEGEVNAILYDISGASPSPVQTLGKTTFTVDSSVTMGGTVGVNVRDAQTTFGVSMTDASGVVTQPYAAFNSSLRSAWYLGGKMAGTNTDRWTFGPSAGGVPLVLTRVMPEIKYKVNVFRNGNELDQVAPVSPSQDWDGDWAYNGVVNFARTASSYSYSLVEVPMHMWDEVFIQIKPEGSDGAIVIDNLECSSWRGQTLFSPGPPSSGDPNHELVWETTYGVAKFDPFADDDGSMVYEMTRSRADPNEDQAIVTPLLVAGIGDILFNYKVVQGTASIHIQALNDEGFVHSTLMTTNVTAAMTPDYERMYVPFLTNMTGRFRILLHPSSSEDASVLIDNIKATDYPDVGDTSWEAYNVLISNYEWNPDIKFDGSANIEYRSATVNNEYDRDTPLGVAYDDDEPYIQSPRISTGIGEVSFWYRMYPLESGEVAKPGKVYLKAAKNVTDFDTDPGSVLTLSVSDLNPLAHTYEAQVADMNALTNIQNQVWTKFSVEFFQDEYKVLRIYGDTMTGGRVMLDNIIVTEPVRSSIDIGFVRLIPEVPLYTDTVGVEVDLVNPRMNPENISVDFLYYEGTNLWGVNNWKNSAVRVPLTKDPNDKYYFYSSNAIPPKAIDTVIQYTVEVSYEGTFPSPVFYDGVQTPFANPEWYEPVDLNKTFASRGVSPYYFVFSVGVGTNGVYINEFLPFAFFGGPIGLGEQYVELIGPAGANIENWRIEHVKVLDGASIVSDTVIWTNIMKTGASLSYKPEGDPNPKGWGFYLLACPLVSNTNNVFNLAVNGKPIVIDQELFPPYLYTANYSAFVNPSTRLGMDVPGAMRLRRSMGADVHRLAWGTQTQIQPLVDRGYTPLPSRGITTAARRQVYMWSQSGDELDYVLQGSDRYSPGYYNYGQELLLWEVDAAAGEPPVTVQPQVAISVSSIAVDSAKTTVLFDVNTINSVALTSSDGFTWYVETSDDPSFAVSTAHQLTTSITADENGNVSTFSVDVPHVSPTPQKLFYRIKAVHP